MSQKQLIILAVTGGFIVLLVVVGLLSQEGILPGVSAPSGSSGTSSGGADGMMDGVRMFTPQVPVGATPTVPDIAAPASQDSEVQFGAFNVSVSARGFDPATITVKFGDLVQMNLSAVGSDCDFSLPYLGLSTRAGVGETKQVSFQTTLAGTYDFICAGFSSGETVRGNLIVTP